MNRKNVKEAILAHIKKHGSVQNLDIARATGLTRQAIHFHLEKLLSAGVLVVEGQGRSTRYRLALPKGSLRLSVKGLEEDQAWEQLKTVQPSLARLKPNDAAIVRYAFLELINNAIEHAQAREVTVVLEQAPKRLAFEISDDGIGIFEHLRSALGLAGHLEALQELSKGKLTTQPDRHTGEGIFFTSKAADRFTLESDGLRWEVDNRLPDMAVLEAPARTGTRVRFERALGRKGTLEELFAQYTEDFQFTRTRTVVRLFEIGAHFVSRSEARRLTANLEKFREVILDFQGVLGVGQGFVDEVFRVWQRAHPEVRLVPVNMNTPVEFMVRRGLPPKESP